MKPSHDGTCSDARPASGGSVDTVTRLLRDQRALVAGYEALLLLFEVRFLVEIGLSREQAKVLATGRVHHWTIEKAISENYPALADLIARNHRRRPKR